MSLDIIAVAYPPPGDMAPRNLTQITDYIIHHEAGSLTETALDIDAQHRGEGWAMIGYNYVIDVDGKIYAGRPCEYVPSAAYGRNLESVNVSCVGNFQSDDKGYTGPPTPEQINALIELGIYLHQKYPTITRTIGHRDVATMFYPNDQSDYATACPGDMLYEHIPAIKTAIAAKVNPFH